MKPILRTALRMTAALAWAAVMGCERPAPAPGPVASPAGAGPDTAPPAVPGGLQAYAISESDVRLTWEPSGGGRGPVSYEVLRGDSLAGRTPSLDAVDQALAADQEYCYAVQAVDAAGIRSGRAGPVCVRTPDRTPPTAPGAPVVTILEPGGAGLEWPPSTDNVWVEGYEVLRDDRVVASGAERTAGESGLAPGRPYCWTVRAFDRAGNRSPPSAPGCATTPDRSPPTVPGPVTATPGPGSVDLAWAPATDDAGIGGYEVLEGDAVVATVETTTWAGRGLPAGERCYTVRAFDPSGNRSAPAGPACGVVPDTTPPSRPEGLTASAPGETAVVLRWQAARDDVGVAGYEVVRGEALVARSGGPAAGEEGLRAAQEYCYQVRALDASGNRSEPSAAACVTTPDLSPPSAPRQVGAVATSDRTVDVSWRPSTDNVGVAGYDLLRGEEVVARSDALVGEVLRVQVTGLAPGREHCFSVRARDLAGLRSDPSPRACAATPDLSPPTTPSAVQAVAVSGAQVALAWQPSTDDVGVVRYEVLRGVAMVASVPGTEAEELGLGAATGYCYRVRAVDAAGNRSAPSAEACATTAEPGVPAAPTRLEASAAGPRSVTLRWQPSADAGAVYAVFWEKGQRIGTTRFTTYRVDGLKPGERRCFQVASLNAAGQSSAATFPACAQAGSAAAQP